MSDYTREIVTVLLECYKATPEDMRSERGSGAAAFLRETFEPMHCCAEMEKAVALGAMRYEIIRVRGGVVLRYAVNSAPALILPMCPFCGKGLEEVR